MPTASRWAVCVRVTGNKLRIFRTVMNRVECVHEPSLWRLPVRIMFAGAKRRWLCVRRRSLNAVAHVVLLCPLSPTAYACLKDVPSNANALNQSCFLCCGYTLVETRSKITLL